jgi:hypothetical protein
MLSDTLRYINLADLGIICQVKGEVVRGEGIGEGVDAVRHTQIHQSRGFRHNMPGNRLGAITDQYNSFTDFLLYWGAMRARVDDSSLEYSRPRVG